MKIKKNHIDRFIHDKNLMKYVQNYFPHKGLKNIGLINHVLILKKLIYQFKLIGEEGHYQSNSFDEPKTLSSILWEYYFLNAGKLGRRINKH